MNISVLYTYFINILQYTRKFNEKNSTKKIKHFRFVLGESDPCSRTQTSSLENILPPDAGGA